MLEVEDRESNPLAWMEIALLPVTVRNEDFTLCVLCVLCGEFLRWTQYSCSRAFSKLNRHEILRLKKGMG